MNIENFIQVEKTGITIRPPHLCWSEKSVVELFGFWKR